MNHFHKYRDPLSRNLSNCAVRDPCDAVHGLSELSDPARAVVRLWLGLHGASGDVPSWKHFDPMQVKELLPRILVLERGAFDRGSKDEACSESRGWSCRLFAAGLVDQFGVELTGVRFDEGMFEVSNCDAFAELFQVASLARPRILRGHVRLCRLRQPERNEVVLLPFRSGKPDVTIVMCVLVPQQSLFLEDGSFLEPQSFMRPTF